jgi:IPT/TIG domain
MDRAPSTNPAHDGDRPREPNRRALAAMASAASRARRSGGGVGVADPEEETGPRRLVARSTTTRPTSTVPVRDTGRPVVPPPDASVRARVPARRPAMGTAPRADWRTRWELDARRTRTILLIAGVGILVLAVIGLALGLALQSPATPGTGRAGSTHHGGGPTSKGKAANPSASKSTPGTGGSASTTSPPARSPASGAAPRLVSASPDAGRAGETVVIDGSALFSTDGEVVAYFGGAQAPTSCSSQTSCTVTVPELGPRPSTEDLTVVTASGTSNVLTFHYR